MSKSVIVIPVTDYAPELLKWGSDSSKHPKLVNRAQFALLEERLRKSVTD